ncbi:PH domain-containing protein [uncultured Methanobrevibacter sp.]|uniref:PH domain-containing protein n=1 Tax=uncultured Methanobrevibacter sp. TaxID=253161 RepID=UPI002631D23D|nr:PH domain-containing protein [uncultured Methanobrevibacter sp.]
MLFNKNDKIANEKIIYQTKPNMLLGCKKAIFGVILLIVVLSVASPIISFIGEMQVYLISYVKLSLTRYAAIALFVIILFIILYIIGQLINWYYMEYILTDSRIIVKSGVLYTKKNYMPYGTIQDVSSSQSIMAKILNVGTISVYSAYDNNQMKLANISNVSEVEDIIFSRISNHTQEYHSNNFTRDRLYKHNNIQKREYHPNNDYYESYKEDYSQNFYLDDNENYESYDDYYEKEPSRNYEYYPEELNFEEEKRHNYEYEPYHDDYLERNIGEAIDNLDNDYPDRNQYNETMNDYSYGDEDYYVENEGELYYNDPDNQDTQLEETHHHQANDSKETIIRRHFDKFKK